MNEKFPLRNIEWQDGCEDKLENKGSIRLEHIHSAKSGMILRISFKDTDSGVATYLSWLERVLIHQDCGTTNRSLLSPFFSLSKNQLKKKKLF